MKLFQKPIFIFTILFTVVSLSSMTITKEEEDTLEAFCQNYQGQVKRGFVCPKSKLPLPLKMCHFTNNYNEYQFFDGCTGPTGKYKNLFYPSCIKHDLCYHHEPETNGFSQEDCDLQFYNSMKKACETLSENQKNCLNWAKAMYKGVRAVGKAAYHCENVKAHY